MDLFDFSDLVFECLWTEFVLFLLFELVAINLVECIIFFFDFTGSGDFTHEQWVFQNEMSVYKFDNSNLLSFFWEITRYLSGSLDFIPVSIVFSY